MIPQYSCVKWIPTDSRTGKCQIDRVLAFKKSTAQVSIIEVYSNKAKIRILNRAPLERAVKEGTAEVVELSVKKRKYTKAAGAYMERVWNELETFRNSNQSYLFDCHIRSDTVKTAMKITGKSEPTVRTSLRRLLQGGCVREGILCHFGNCGIPTGLGRAVKAAKKRGRKKLLKHLGLPRRDAPIDEADQCIFIRVIKDHLMGISNRHVSYEWVYNNRLDQYYNTGIGEQDPSKRMIPGFNQFKYFIQTNEDPESKKTWAMKIKESRKTSAAKGTGGRNKDSEDASLDPQGPGDVYQIDSTQADIDLVVSETNRRVIGRATVYLVIDVFSHCIVGVHVTLAPPCYEEAVIALVSVLEDKVELCKRYGIRISPDQWPNTPLPSTLIADRQEFIWKNSNLLLTRHSIRTVNTPKYRGDFKGLVEAHLGRQMRVVWTFPGAIDPQASKDERSTKGDAVLTLREFTKLLLLDIIIANDRHLPSISLPPEAAHSDVLKHPKDVMKWGLDNISGLGKAGTVEDALCALLTLTSHAHTTTEGLRVSAAGATSIYYSNYDGKLPKHLFDPGNGTDLCTQFDSRSMNYVRVEHPETKEIVVLPLSKRSREYTGCTWQEGAHYQLRQKEGEAINEPASAAASLQAQAMIDQTLDNAVTRAKGMPRTSLAALTADQKGQRVIARREEMAGRRERPKPEFDYDPTYEE